MKQAEMHVENGHFALARHYYESVLAENVGHLEALNNLGVVLFREGRIDEAIKCFQEVLKKDQSHTDATVNLEACIDVRQSPLPDGQQCLKVGFISVWFERGQSYVTKMIRDAVASRHDTFVFARTGGIGDKPMMETTGQWAIPHLTVWPRYDIPERPVIDWIGKNHLDAVVFNEEYDWHLVEAVRRAGVKTITYLDYYKNEWQKNMGLYDAVLCSTHRTYNLVKEACRAHYIGWGVDTALFHPPVQEPPFTFFHNAGWLGNNYRKMTPAVIAAFDALTKRRPDWSLFVHSQLGLDNLPPVVSDIVTNNPLITYHVETLPAPGLYHMGKIMVFPTKLEGLGLPLFEGLSSGLPVITTNAPPMNEFVRHGYNGLLVDTAFQTTRDDNIAFPEEIVDMGDLAVKMATLADNATLRHTLSDNARQFAEVELAFPFLAERILSVFKEVCAK